MSTPQQVIDRIRELIAAYTGDETELYERLDTEAEHWRDKIGGYGWGEKDEDY